MWEWERLRCWKLDQWPCNVVIKVTLFYPKFQITVNDFYVPFDVWTVIVYQNNRLYINGIAQTSFVNAYKALFLIIIMYSIIIANKVVQIYLLFFISVLYTTRYNINHCQKFEWSFMKLRDKMNIIIKIVQISMISAVFLSFSWSLFFQWLVLNNMFQNVWRNFSVCLVIYLPLWFSFTQCKYSVHSSPKSCQITIYIRNLYQIISYEWNTYMKTSVRQCC